MNTSDLRVKKTKRALKQAMIDLISEKSFDKISVIDICSRAMVNRATFYSHYADKYALFEACIRDFMKPFETLEPDNTSIDEFKNYYIDIARSIFAHAEQNKKFYESIFKRDDYSEGYIRRYIRDKLLNNMKYSAERGLVLPAPADVMAAYYSGATASLVHWWIDSGFKISSETLCEYLDMLISHAIEKIPENMEHQKAAD